MAAIRGRGALVAAVACVCAALFSPASALSGPRDWQAAVPQTLLDQVNANPGGSFSVIVQGDDTERSSHFADRLSHDIAKDQGKSAPGTPFGGRVHAQFDLVDGFSASLSGNDILRLARKNGVRSIVPDSPVSVSGNPQKWPAAIGADWFAGSSYGSTTKAATIAFVDSGIDNSTGAFGNRILRQVDLGGGSSSGDPRGHGTFVAGLAAGSGLYAGVAPDANIVSLDVFDAQGNGTVGNVIRAADWILANKNAYNIRVANFSLQSSQPSSFLYDPLDKAVERLWQAGIVVVAAAGNYATNGQPSGVLFAPGNDPFVLTAGAVDVRGSASTWDDRNAPWSAYGYTPDGFSKPELAAPGRYMIEQISPNATLLSALPANVLNGFSGTIQLSGTSFSTAVVSGMAADLLGVHPDWTADQVKGELMLSAIPVRNADPGSLGVGEANLYRSLSYPTGVSSPPNPNAALDQFLVSDPSGGSLPLFDSAGWMNAAKSNPSWDAASWTSASWTSASWSSASWSTASWSSASWTSASWTSASWTSASWSSASWSNNANGDGQGDG
jgi:serine protease AprX